jgi:hypothetical protein
VTQILHRRAERVRSRAAVRAWEYRQRRHARGAWGQLRRLLALSSAAYTIPDDVALRLLDEGHEPDPVGNELEPRKTILCLPPHKLELVDGAREVPVRLGPEILIARSLVLIPFSF